MNFRQKFIHDNISLALNYFHRLGKWDQDFVLSIHKAIQQNPDDELSHNNFRQLQDIAQKVNGFRRVALAEEAKKELIRLAKLDRKKKG